MELALLVLPMFAILIYLCGILKERKIFHTVNICVSTAMFVLAVILTGRVIQNGIVTSDILGGIFYLDSMSIIVLDIVVVIGFMTSIYSIGYLEEELKHGKIVQTRFNLYYILLNSFLFTMVFALTVKNLGLIWIAIEATTLASTFLVGFYNDKQSIEAAWKYVMICSGGIAAALLGIIFLHVSSVGVIGNSNTLDWTALMNNASSLNSSTLRFSFIFIIIGFGTKAGLAPMHTWLPDAHSQAPSPISAMLSGVLINSAMYAIIRIIAVVNKNLGNASFTGTIMMVAGILSILIAAIFILTQKDYKRLLAYSSVEHMGIIAFAFGLFTPASIFGGFFHMINHSITKPMLFLCAGSTLQKYGTRDIFRVRNLLKYLPFTGTAFLLGLFAIAGTPPFSVFASEFNIVLSAFNSDRFYWGAVLVLLLALVFVGIALSSFSMFYGNTAQRDITPGENNKAGTVVILLMFAAICVMGIYMPQGLKYLINDAQKMIIGG